LNSESRLVTYVNKKGERQTLPLNHALESNNAEMTKRLKYTKDILTHMLNNNNGNGGVIGGNIKISLKLIGGSSTALTGATSSGAVGAGSIGVSSRMGTITSAVSSKRSAMGDVGLPSSVGGGRTSSSNALNMLSSDRRPLNVLNQG
jgi:hypothetical protein